jgi:hypothetical protein
MAEVKDTSDDREWRREIVLANGDVWILEHDFNATSAWAYQKDATHAQMSSKFFGIVVDPANDSCIADLDALIGGLQALRTQLLNTEAQFWT